MRYLYAILALGVALALHELGHVLAARLLNVRVRRFKLGFGPPLLAFHAGGVELKLGAIPLGASADILGMNPHDEPPAGGEEGASLLRRSAWTRLFILLAGPLASYLTALSVLTALYLVGTHVPVPMMVGLVEPGSPAARAQLRPGDVVVAVGKDAVHQWADFAAEVADAPGRRLELQLLRQGEPFKATVVPTLDGGVGRIGVSQQYVYRRQPLPEAALGAAAHIHRLTLERLSTGLRLLRGKEAMELAGPVTMVRQASDTAATGLNAFLRVLVTLSVAVALFHLLPIPPLDGGRLLLLALEKITGRAVRPVTETLLQLVGFLLLAAATAWVAFHGLLAARSSATTPPSLAPPVTKAQDAGTSAPPVQDADRAEGAGRR